jgi:hypothetical protein
MDRLGADRHAVPLFLSSLALLGGCGSSPSAAADAGVLAADDGSRTEPDAGMAAEDPTGFRDTAPLAVARFAHTAIALPDGRVVVIGGETDGAPALAIEVFDPSTETFAELAVLPAPRENHTATLLADGRVLIAGGGDANAVGGPAGTGLVAAVSILDPATGALEDVAPLRVPRSHHTATRLPSGEVAVIGGAIASSAVGEFGDATSSVEIYDPASGTWRDGPDLPTRRFLHTASLLAGGAIAIVGGSDETEREIVDVDLLDADLLDGGAAAWMPGPELGTSRVFHAALELASGELLVAAGKLANIAFLETSEILSPDATSWAPGPSLPESRTGSTLTLLPSSRALSIGGLHGSRSGFRTLADAHLFDPEVRAWTEIGGLGAARVLHSAAVLPGGRVLVCGGLGASGSALATCEIAD